MTQLALCDDPSRDAAAGRDTSCGDPRDASRLAAAGPDASRSPGTGEASIRTGATRRVCAWCNSPIPAAARRDAVCCSVRCRQARHRFNRAVGHAARVAGGRALRLAYADPPYPGKAWLYRGHPDYAGEVDHAALIGRLVLEYDGWALSTSAAALPAVLALCPPGVRVAAWHRGERPTPSRWPLNAWEPVIYRGGRPADPSRADVVETRRVDSLVCGVSPLTTLPGRVTGTKPAAFCRWVFGLLGAAPGDTLDDLFPGSGAVTRAWAAYTADTSRSDTVQTRRAVTPADPSRAARAGHVASVADEREHVARIRARRVRRGPARRVVPDVGHGGDRMSLHLVPVTFADACGFIAMWHRHHAPPRGMKFTVGVASDAGVLVGVAVAGRPVARQLDDGATLEVTRVATNGTPHACSMLYAACWRAAKALGYRRLVTYTQQGETGASLRAAGWHVIAARRARPGWNRPSRPRCDRGTEGIPRTLWEAAP